MSTWGYKTDNGKFLIFSKLISVWKVKKSLRKQVLLKRTLPKLSNYSKGYFTWLRFKNSFLGPSLWSKWYPVADLGERQSPIDIKTAEAVPAADTMAQLSYKYDPANVKIVNTGSSWRMDFSAEGSDLSGGPLEGNYKVA